MDVTLTSTLSTNLRPLEAAGGHKSAEADSQREFTNKVTVWQASHRFNSPSIVVCSAKKHLFDIQLRGYGLLFYCLHLSNTTHWLLNEITSQSSWPHPYYSCFNFYGQFLIFRSTMSTKRLLILTHGDVQKVLS